MPTPRKKKPVARAIGKQRPRTPSAAPPRGSTGAASAKAKAWFTCKAGEDEGVAEISIYDEIGAWGIHAKDFQSALRSLGDVSEIRVRINSPGGEVFDGLAIHNMLRRHKARVVVTVDGLAASIASVIAMAGDEVEMPSNALMMIHDPSGFVVGTSKEMRELADALDKIKTGLIAAYARKSGLDTDRIAELMAAESWLTAGEAKELGFCDTIAEPTKANARFDCKRFRNVPEAIGMRRPRAASEAREPAGPKEDTLPSKAERPAVDQIQAVIDGLRAEGDGEEANAAVADWLESVVNATEEDDDGDESGADKDDDDDVTDEGDNPDEEDDEDEPSAKKNRKGKAARKSSSKAVLASERKRASDITAACNLIGRGDLAAGFIDKGTSLSDAVAELRKAKPAQASVNPRHTPGAVAPSAAKAGWDKAVAGINARVKA